MIIQTPDFKASEKLIDFVTENVEKLNTISERILEGHVLLKVEKSDTNKNKICELKLVIPGNDIFAARQSETFEAAVSEAIEAAKHQMKRWKNSKSVKQQRGTTVPPVTEEGEALLE